jgi:hypothetical protein
MDSSRGIFKSLLRLHAIALGKALSISAHYTPLAGNAIVLGADYRFRSTITLLLTPPRIRESIRPHGAGARLKTFAAAEFLRETFACYPA